jgi:hypothetical protein
VSEPAEIVLPLPERHPEPAQGPHAPKPEGGAARAEAHEHSLDLVVRMVPRREDVHVAAHHRVEHQLVARVARWRLDCLTGTRSLRVRRLAPGHAQLDVRRLEPCRCVFCGARHLSRVGLEAVIYVNGQDGIGKVDTGFVAVLLLPVDHASEEIEKACRVRSRGARDGYEDAFSTSAEVMVTEDGPIVVGQPFGGRHLPIICTNSTFVIARIGGMCISRKLKVSGVTLCQCKGMCVHCGSGNWRSTGSPKYYPGPLQPFRGMAWHWQSNKKRTPVLGNISSK